MKLDILLEPKYAAMAGAILGIIAKYVEKRFTGKDSYSADDRKKSKSKPPNSLWEYIKCAAYSGALLGAFAYLIKKGGLSSSVSDSSSHSGGGPGGYVGGGGGGGGDYLRGGTGGMDGYSRMASYGRRY
jgi:hypothetical protein